MEKRGVFFLYWYSKSTPPQKISKQTLFQCFLCQCPSCRWDFITLLAAFLVYIIYIYYIYFYSEVMKNEQKKKSQKQVQYHLLSLPGFHL